MLLKHLALFKYLLLLCLLASCNSETTQKPKSPTLQNSSTLNSKKALDTLEAQKYLMGLFDPQKDDRFVTIDSKLADQEGRLMRKEAYQAFEKMHAAALKDGIDLKIRSATRNFDYQKGIWERKWTGETKLSSGEDASLAYSNPEERALNILKYSSMPGTSRHHWGTDIDLNNFNNEWFESGEGLLLYEWLNEHAHKFGYCRPYTAKDSLRPYGYNEEKWHWSYMPLSDSLTQLSKNLLQADMINGFLGSTTAKNIEVIDRYVLGISSACH